MGTGRTDQAARKPITDAGLAAAKVETWTEKIFGAVFVCFRNERGELFHFKQAELRRGKPRAPYRSIEEFTRGIDELSIENVANITGLKLATVQHLVWNKVIPAITKRWSYGMAKRSGSLVKLADLKKFLVKRTLEKYSKMKVEMDVEPRELIDDEGKST